MKKIIKEPEIEYRCDICGEIIDNTSYGFLDLVTFTTNEMHGNGWNEWVDKKEYHVHRKCIQDVFMRMKR